MIADPRDFDSFRRALSLRICSTELDSISPLDAAPVSVGDVERVQLSAWRVCVQCRGGRRPVDEALVFRRVRHIDRRCCIDLRPLAVRSFKAASVEVVAMVRVQRFVIGCDCFPPIIHPGRSLAILGALCGTRRSAIVAWRCRIAARQPQVAAASRGRPQLLCGKRRYAGESRNR